MSIEDQRAERWSEVAELLDRALDLAPEERLAFVRAELEVRPGIRREVEELVAHSLHEESFLDRGVEEAVPALFTEGVDPDKELDDDLCGRRLGRWKILRRIGAGGMGHVYLAERADGQFEQRAALKVVPGSLGSHEMRRRFLAERQILAGLSHPNIAGLLDGGIGGTGLPFLVMEYVNGKPITEYCDEAGCNIPERLDLFRDVCSAVSSAHASLVVHGDLKPGNIFVARDGTVKLLDFGIARIVEATPGVKEGATTAVALLTPAYAAPEQLLNMPLTTASDVYSLGVVLYQLLTGLLPHEDPFGVKSAVVRAVRGEEAPPPSATASGERRRELRGDLDSIVLKALLVDPAERYPSVERLADDLRAFLAGRPVAARPATPAYRLAKLLRRHRVAAAAVVVALLALVGGAMALVQWAGAAGMERQRSERVAAFLGDILRISDPGDGAGFTISAPQLIDHSMARAKASFGGEPEIHVRVLRVLGDTAHHLQLYRRAVSVRLEEVRLSKQLHGDESSEVAWALGRLGESLLATGDVESGVSLLRRARGIASSAGEGSTPEFAGLLIDGALALRGLSRPNEVARAEARELLQAAVTLTRHLGDPEGEAEAWNALAGFAASPEETVARLRDVLALRRRNHTGSDEGIARTLNDLALALEDAGDRDQAIPYARQALEMHRELRGEDDPTTVQLLSNVAGLLRDAGEFTAAEPMYRHVLAWRREHYPPDAMPVVFAEYGMARVAMGLGRLDEAELGLRHVLGELERRRHVLRFVAESALGECLARRGDHAAAGRHLRAAAKGARQAFGQGSPQAREAIRRLHRFAPPEARSGDVESVSERRHGTSGRPAAPGGTVAGGTEPNGAVGHVAR